MMPERQLTDRMTQPLNDAELVTLRALIHGDPHTGTKPSHVRLNELERVLETMYKIMYGDKSTQTDGMLSVLKRVDEQNEKTNWNLERNRKQMQWVSGILGFIGIGGIVAVLEFAFRFFTN